MTLGGLVLFALAGCAILDAVEETKESIEDVKNVVDGLTNPIVTQGIVLGVQEPDDPALADIVSTTDLGKGTAVTVFLADAANAEEIESAPVSGAQVTVDGSDVVDATEQEAGVYSVDPGVLAYKVDDVWTVEVQVEGEKEVGLIPVLLPAAADLDPPSQIEPGTDVALDFSGMGFASALVVVLNSQGDVTWTNEPDSASEVLGITQSEGDLTELVVPGADAFPKDDLYALGVAGMVHSKDTDIENMNTVLSSLMAGKMRFYGVSAVKIPGR